MSEIWVEISEISTQKLMFIPWIVKLSASLVQYQGPIPNHQLRYQKINDKHAPLTAFHKSHP